MKKLFTLIALLAATAGTTLSAQCIKVYPKGTPAVITYPIASLGDMTFSTENGESFVLSVVWQLQYRVSTRLW